MLDIASAPDPVLVDDDVPLVHPELGDRDVGLAVRGPPDRALHELGDVDQGGDEQDRQDVAEQVPGVAPVKIITISLVYIQCFKKTCIITHSSDANRARTNSFNNDSKQKLQQGFFVYHCTLHCYV